MKQLLSLLLSISFLTGFAGKVELEKAKLVGKNFYYERVNQQNQIPYATIHINGTFTELFNGQAVYHVLNFDNGGWIIISADDGVTPVLAYSFERTYSPDNQPPQFIAWMEGYAKQIDYSRDHGLAATEAVQAQWEALAVQDPCMLNLFPESRDVAPLLTSNWNQGSPYNFLCPADPAGPGGHALAGCVATAMAQVIYYYRWPETGVGLHCYIPSGYSLQCADFANTTYHWNEMTNSMSNKDTAMALIQWHCGISVNMMYGPSGSGAYSHDAAAALRNYFKYHPNTDLVDKASYTEDEWATLLRDNIDASRPMYYHGFGSGGHAFNVDGYQGSDHFHFNWGWGGSYNGYFYLNNLNPGGANFTNGQGAIVNIYPDTLTYTYPTYCSGQTVLTNLRGAFEDGSSPLDYENNADCSWLITPQSISDSVVSITVSFQRFNTELNADLVTIYQGTTTAGDMIAQYSGNDIPDEVTIDGNQALVTFTSDGITTNPGWFASYTSESMNWCTGITTLTDPDGSLSDGSFYFNYKNSSMCRWKIIPEGAGAIELSFTSFRTESENDILRIYDLGSETLIATYSGIYTGGDVPPPVAAPSGKMFLIFSTNASVTEAGWEAEYFTYAVGTEEESPGSSLTVFPNPATNRLTLQLSAEEIQKHEIELLDMNGKIVLVTRLFTQQGVNRKVLDISNLSPGIYLLRVISENEVITKKIAIR